MEIQGFAIILLIFAIHLFLIKPVNKERFALPRFRPLRVNCGDCFQRKTKSQCVRALTGKYCDTPCKWSKTIRHGPDGSKSVIEFCEENNPFYDIRRFW